MAIVIAKEVKITIKTIGGEITSLTLILYLLVILALVLKII